MMHGQKNIKLTIFC